MQGWLLEHVFSSLPVHECAAAYKQGSSIKKNAEVHARQSYIVKTDFNNFFNSVKAVDLERLFKKYFLDVYSESDLNSIVQLCCYRSTDNGLCLSVGAPASPLLSNAIMYDFDEKMAQWCSARKIKYSRYADDLTFSTNVSGLSSEILPAVKHFVEVYDWVRLKINDEKTVHVSKKYQRRVTGLILSNDGQVSLGRERKRLISSQIHKFKAGTLERNEVYKLQGLLAFAADVEPIFIIRMNIKYGNETLSELFKIRRPPVEQLLAMSLSELGLGS